MTNLSTTSTNGATTVGATTTAVLTASGGRKGIIFTNDSDEVIYLGFGTAAVLNSGARLNASGGALVLDNSLMTTQAINAICTSGSKVLTYVTFNN